jgi:hypothetical protein
MFRAISLVVFGVAVLVVQAPSAAAGTVGVIATGEASLQPALVAQLESWLRSHGHQVMGLSLDPSAATRLVDCFTVDDTSCARKVVEAKSRTDSVVFARMAREGKTLSLSVYWIVKGRPPAGGRRGCEDCTEDALRGAADELMASLAPAATVSTGRLNLHSKPDGMIVMLDGSKIGVTPIERDIAAGEHSIVLVDGGTRVGERTVKIPEGATIELTMPVVYPRNDVRNPPPPPPPSRVPPVLCWVGGGLLLGGSGVAFYYGQKGGAAHPDDKYIYRGAKPAGVGLAAGGVAVIGVGVWLWIRGSTSESAPVAALGPGGGYLGWQGRF